VIAVAALVITPAGLAAVGTVAYLDRGSGTSTDPASQAEGFTWPAGKRPAPSFAIQDQSGHRVTPRSGGRQLTILAFVDPVCRALCPLEAAVLGRVEQALPAGSRPTIVAVSVDPWGTTMPT
jgi:cytochrome oxidase Cu insertion factor (SCO1/SenC/PrrC family)